MQMSGGWGHAAIARGHGAAIQQISVTDSTSKFMQLHKT
jgi:hypothetical protein